MLQPDQGTMAVLAKLGANYRFRCISPQMRKTGDKDFEPITAPVFLCDIIDNITGEVYAHGEGADRLAALHAAVASAVDAPKPMTPAQRATQGATADVSALKAKIGSKDAEIEELRSKVRDLTEKIAGKSGGKAKGRIAREDGLPDSLVGAEAV